MQQGVPLEEIAALFGDTDEVMVFSKDIHVDHATHELVIDTHGAGAGAGDGSVAARVATEPGRPGGVVEKAHETVVEKV